MNDMFIRDQILEQLKKIGAPQNSVVLVHSSLRSVGQVEGNGEQFLDILIEYFTAEGGLLCIPTHTWANISDEGKITLDLLEPKTCIGTLPDIAAKHTDAVRSMHPTHSMAVFGDKEHVKAFVSGEEQQITPAHPSGCYGKILDNDGYILLIGVGHNRNTYLHCVEEMLDMPNRIAKDAKKVTVRHASGEIEHRIMHPHEAVGIGDVSLRYPKYEPAFRYHGCIVDGRIGNAPTQLCSARKMKEVIELINLRSGGIELLLDDIPLRRELYIK